LKNEKKKVRFDRLQSPWRDPFFDPSGPRPILWEQLVYGDRRNTWITPQLQSFRDQVMEITISGQQWGAAL